MPETAVEQLEHTLRDLARVGTLIKDRGYRQVWRFEYNGKGYYLKFYPRGGGRDWFRRATRGSPAKMEFDRLQWLQKAAIPAPRAVAVMYGFTGIPGQHGDAVILQAIEPSVALDEYLNERELAGEPVPEHRDLADQVIDLVYRLGKAGYGHEDLHLGNFLLHDGRVYLVDAYGVREGGLKEADVLHLGASVGRFATTADIVRGWRTLHQDDEARPPPKDNSVGRRLLADALYRMTRNRRYIGRIESAGWAGLFFRHTKHPRRWSEASRLEITGDDWAAAWPGLLAQIEADALPVLKRSRSGDVLAARVTLGGRDLDVVIKRPRRRYWYRYLNEIGRGPRPRRAWFKAWDLIVRNLPTAWPLAVFERRRFGYVVDAVLVSERVPGPTLWQADLDGMTAEERDNLFRRVGKILRLIDRYGFSHFDAKASNWIVRADAALGPDPVMIDPDGVRRRRWVALGIRRLLRSLREKRQYTPEDSYSLCRGYAPYARLDEETPLVEAGDEMKNEK